MHLCLFFKNHFAALMFRHQPSKMKHIRNLILCFLLLSMSMLSMEAFLSTFLTDDAFSISLILELEVKETLEKEEVVEDEICSLRNFSEPKVRLLFGSPDYAYSAYVSLSKSPPDIPPEA